jgi:hypothetical protein
VIRWQGTCVMSPRVTTTRAALENLQERGPAGAIAGHHHASSPIYPAPGTLKQTEILGVRGETLGADRNTLVLPRRRIAIYATAMQAPSRISQILQLMPHGTSLRLRHRLHRVIDHHQRAKT